jgi:hypothetical protein
MLHVEHFRRLGAHAIMSTFDRAIECAMTVVLIVGGYQLYFWAQRQQWFPARSLLDVPAGVIVGVAVFAAWAWPCSDARRLPQSKPSACIAFRRSKLVIIAAPSDMGVL